MTRWPRSSLMVGFALLTLLAAAPAAGQAVYPITILVRTGDSIPDVGNVTAINNLAVGVGEWTSFELDTNADASTDGIVIRNGAVLAREGIPLSLPAGASISSFDSLGINAQGDVGWNLFLRGLTTTTDSGIFFNTTLVIQESNISTAPEFSPNTPYIGWFDAKMNDNNLMMLVASVDDPVITSTVDRALVRVQVTASGGLVSESVLAKEGDILPGQSQPVADFGTATHQTALNNAGQIVYFADLTGDTSVDGVIYRDTTLLAQEGSPSPAPGRNWELLSSRSLDVNDHGDVVFKANLDGDASNDEVVAVESGYEDAATLLVREGDTLPAIAPWHLTSFGATAAPVFIDEAENVLWFGDWDNPDLGKDTGLFVNDVLVASEGQSIGSRTLATLASGEDAFEMSDDGRRIVFESTLDDGSSAGLRLEITGPRAVPDGAVIPGGQMLASKNPNMTDIDVTWDATSCPNTEYNIFYGDLAAVSSLEYIGAACSLGVTGSASFTPPDGNLFFVLVGEDSQGVEGGHGFDGFGHYRRTSAGGRCGVVGQIRSLRCPAAQAQAQAGSL